MSKNVRNKKNIDINVLFKDLPDELKYIYKNVIKLNFEEKPDYDLYILLLKNILNKFGIINYTDYIFPFYKNLISLVVNIKTENNEKKCNEGIYKVFEGYPISINY